MSEEPYKLLREVEEDKDELNNVFYGDKTLMTSYPKFKEKLKEDEEEHPEEKVIPNDESEFYYENQSVTQVFKPHEREMNHKHIVAYYPLEKIYMDSMYLRLGKSTLGFVNGIDLFSKFAFSRMFILPKQSQAILSSKSKEVFDNFFNKMKEEYPRLRIAYVITDLGSEFLGDFKKDLQEKLIPHIYATAGDKYKTSPIERFNKTLRLYIEKYRTVYGKIDNSVLQTIINAYNNVSHGELHNSPIEILKNPDAQDYVELYNINENKLNDLVVIPIGSSVRKLIERTPFKKIKPVWSNKIYTVEGFHHNTYTLEGDDGIYRKNELQVVNKDFIQNDEKVNIKHEPQEVEQEEEEEVKPAIMETPQHQVPEVNIRPKRGERLDYATLHTGRSK